MSNTLNLLSGATIDTRSAILYDLLKSETCFMGFGRNIETWGQLCLIKYKAVSSTSSGAPNPVWPSDVVGTGGGFLDKYDFLVSGKVNTPQEANIAKIGSYEYTGDISIIPDPSLLTYISNPYAPPAQEPEVVFINEEWIVLKYVNPEQLWPIESINGNPIKYFIVNQNQDPTNMLEIEKVEEYQYPGLDVEVKLKYTTAETINAYESDYVPISTPLMRRINLQGEYIITGATKEFIDWFVNNNASTYNFMLIDASIPSSINGTDENLLLHSIRFEELIESPEETALIFSYAVWVGSPGNEYQIRPRFKITTLANINNKYAVYHESLPVWQHISPVSDENPPGLPVEYLRNPSIHRSLFDAVGIAKIKETDVWFCKEFNESELTYWQQEVADNTSKFEIEIDQIEIDIDSVTEEKIYQYYIKTKDTVYGLKRGFSNVMVIRSLTNELPTPEIYRQFFISYKPKVIDQATGTLIEAVAEYYNGRETFYSEASHKIDMGTVFYLANKIPIYRRFINGNLENFKIII